MTLHRATKTNCLLFNGKFTTFLALTKHYLPFISWNSLFLCFLCTKFCKPLLSLQILRAVPDDKQVY